MKLKITKIAPPTAEIYYQGEFLGCVNEYEFNDLRIKIKQKELEGYEVRTPEGSSFIRENGQLENWPNDLFPLLDKQMMALLDWKV